MIATSGAAHTNEPELQARLKARIWHEWVLSTTALLVLTFCLGFFSDALRLTSLGNTLYDRLVALFVQAPASSDIMIVAIDDASIQEFGYWPWRRAQHARLLQQLADARAVGFDLVFSEPNPAYPDDDAVLAQAIRDHGRVVLPQVIGRDGRTVLPPIPALASATTHFGTINIYPDTDGVIRSASLYTPLDDGSVLKHISVAMLEAGQRHDTVQQLKDKYGTTALRIAYAQFSHDSAIVPYNKVLDGSIPPETFSGKYVLVGSWSSGLGDIFATPHSSTHGGMPGVEVLANLLNGGLTDQWVISPNRLTLALLSLFPVLISCVAFRYLSPQRAFLFTAVLVSGILLVVALLLHYFLWWLSPLATLIGTGLSYPVWSWRSQQAAFRHIDGQLAVLRDERLIPHSLDTATDSMLQSRFLPIQDRTLLTRIRQLHYAIDAMRIAQHQRNETLRFLSHDMRAPLNSILALTDLQRSDTQSDISDPATLAQFDFYANKTLALVDGFVALSRAEAIEIEFQATNLSELINQCCDGAWIQAHKKKIRIDCSAMPDAAWVHADASLLERAWNNLLDNALKYSPENTVITCSVHRDDDDWIATIQDQGRGMDASGLASAFSPFVRIDEDHPDNPSGVGLGLAFVRTVIARHGGQISVESQPDTGTRFTIRLPALHD